MMTPAQIIVGIALLFGVANAASETPVAPEIPATPGYELSLSFNDDFSGPDIDTTRWGFVFDDPDNSSPSILKRNLWANREEQVYFDRDYLGAGINPFSIHDGVLTISAEPMNPTVRAMVMADLNHQSAQFQATSLRNVKYSSGLISTRGRWHQRYGYFEMRARWDRTKGIWPAFWLLPQGGGWPPEVDIVEALGQEPGTAYHSTHSNNEPRHQTVPYNFEDSPGEWHRYGALWLPGQIDFFIDGKKTVTLPLTADFDVPMYMLVNLGIGGKWPGPLPPDAQFPLTMQIDYVRAWQLQTKAN